MFEKQFTGISLKVEFSPERVNLILELDFGLLGLHGLMWGPSTHLSSNSSL